MKRQLAYALFFCLTLAATPASAQSDAIRGTWSGHWVPDGGVRDAVTVRFSLVDNELTGEIVNPENLEFDSVDYDSVNGSLVAEARGPDGGSFRIEAKIEDETRLNGRLTHNNTSGEMRLTKWTYVPRIR
jgi:hypothetical protein